MKKPSAALHLLEHERIVVASLLGNATKDEQIKVARTARAYLMKHGAVPDEEGRYHEAIDRIAKTLDVDIISRSKATLDRMDALMKANGQESGALGLPTDAACDRWTPSINAALVLGFTLGLANTAVARRARCA